MPKTFHIFRSVFLILLLVSLSLADVGTVLADEGIPTDVPTAEPTEPPVEETSEPVATPAPEETTVEILAQLPENTDVVVLDQSGEAVSLASQTAATIVETGDPMWCPEDQAPTPGANGCTTNYGTIAELIAELTGSNINNYRHDGIIYFAAGSSGGSFTLTTGSIGGGAFGTLNDYNLTLQGGWDPLTGNVGGQTNFGTSTLTIGSNGNTWNGAVTINNMTFNNVTGTSLTVYTSGDHITLNNVDVTYTTPATNQNNQHNVYLDTSSGGNDGNITIGAGSSFDNGANGAGLYANADDGNITITGEAGAPITFTDANGSGSGTNYNGATLIGTTTTLTNVSATGNDGNGISASGYDVLTLNNVNASSNGTDIGTAGNTNNANVGSGVWANGNNNSELIVNGGSFNLNQRYGIEADSDTSIFVQTPPTSCAGNDGGPSPFVGACYNKVVTPTLSVTNSPVVYNGLPQAAVVQASVAGTVSDIRYGGFTTPRTNAGTYTVTADLVPADTATYSSLNNATAGTFVISKATPLITFGADPSPIVGNSFSVIATTTNTQNSTLTYSRVSGPCAHTGPATSSTFSTSGVGTCVVQATGVSTSNFNATSETQSVTIRSANTSPALNVPGPITAEATSPSGAAVTFDVTATDGEDNPDPIPTCNPASGSTFAFGSTTVSCSVTDSAGLTTNGSFTVTVQDVTDPIVTVPANMTVEATGPAGATATFSASASDSVDGPIAVSCSPATGSTFAISTTTVTCSATDTHGNTGSASFTVTVTDTTAPTLSLPSNIIQEAVGPAGNVVTYTATATDNVDGPVATTCTPASGSTFGLGTTTVNCSATDSANNTASGSFTVTIRDTRPPKLTLPANITQEAVGPTGNVVTFTATAKDAVDTVVPVICTPASGSTFGLGTTTVNCSGTDDSNNTMTGTFTVTIRDTTAPALSLPANIIQEALSPAGNVVTFSPTASDIVGGSVPVTCTPASGSTFGLGTTTVNCSVSDGAGNTATGSFTVTVRDTTAPALTLPSDIVEEALGPSGNVVPYVASSSDIVDGPVAVTCTPTSGSTFGITTTTVACSATDQAGNTANGSFTVTVRDTTAPSLTLPADISEEAVGPAGNVVTFIATATDVVNGSVTVSCMPASGSTFAPGTTTVTCTATDSAENTSTDTFTVTIGDSTAPMLTLPADITREAVGPAGNVVTFTATASDIVDGSIPVTCTPSSGSTFPLGTTTVTCSAMDTAENTVTDTFTVTVQDTTAPVIASHADLFIKASSQNGEKVLYGLPSTTDLVDGAGLATCSPASGSIFPVGDTVITCTAVDAHGNAAAPVRFTVHVFEAETHGEGGADLFIPLTGGSNFTIACQAPDSFVVEAEDARILFNNLCGYDALVEGLESASLPGKLPTGASFLGGFTIDVLKGGKSVTPLPKNSSIMLEFDLAGDFDMEDYSALVWNGTTWVEVKGERTADGYFRITLTDGGTFIIVEK